MSKPAPNTLFCDHAQHARSKNHPRPGVHYLGETGPETVLLAAPTLQLLVFVQVLGAVPCLLAGFGLAVAADEAEEEVVGQGTE